MKDSKIIIGPSNGWLYARNIFSLNQQEKFLKSAEASAIELCLSDDNRRIDAVFSGKKLKGFSHLSVHLPDYSSSRPLAEQISLAEKIRKKHKPKSFLVHPLNVLPRYWETLINRNIPVAIENMDKNKKTGYVLRELDELLSDFGLSFVLDVQHAYEHDSTMKYAFDLFQMARSRLVYFHVSGETENNNHVLVHQSRNCEKIVSFLGMVFSEIQLPLILEGEYANSEELRREIEFLKSELGSLSTKY